MSKLLISFIVALFLLIFSTQNLDQVELNLIVGPAVHLPVIVVIAAAFVAGYMSATFGQILKGSKPKKKDIDFEDE